MCERSERGKDACLGQKNERDEALLGPLSH